MRGLAGALLVATALSGCATSGAPGRDAPAAPTLGLTPDDRFGAAPAGAPLPTEADLRWWRAFDDPALGRWVERALTGNTDIAVAAERIQQARALLQAARSRGGPTLTAEGGADLQLRRQPGERRIQPSAALSLGFEADLWGGLRAAEGAAAAGVVRSEHLLQATRLAAASLAARGYVEWRLAQDDHRLLGGTLALQRDALRVVAVRVEAGLSPVLDRDRAQADVAAIEAEQAAAAVRIGRAILALQVLAGERPQLALEPVTGAAATGRPMELPALRTAQPVARPLDLLRLRPDLRAAEEALVAAAADIGVAQAALLPRLRLPGTLAFAAGGGGLALDLASATLSAVLDVTLFDGGAGAAAVDEARSLAREAALLYRQALLQALRQVEEALLAQQGARERIAARQRASVAAQSALEQAQTLYRVGLTSFLDVADAQRIALANQRELLQARADAAAADVRAFEAIGLIEPPPGS
ncbi:MAG: efflux transporter outer membrane subunit [Ramlibacter sp.]